MPTETLTTYVTAEEYLERERAATNTKSEWVDGEIREMTGAKHAHNVICGYLGYLFIGGLVGRPFAMYPGDMKIRIPDGPYYYPDVVIAPDPPEFDDDREDIVLNPTVVVEVLSPSTEADDRGRKLHDYLTIPSLQQYLLVDQFEARIDHYQRDGDAWRLQTARGLDATVACPAIECELPLRDVYVRIVTENPA